MQINRVTSNLEYEEDKDKEAVVKQKEAAVEEDKKQLEHLQKKKAEVDAAAKKVRAKVEDNLGKMEELQKEVRGRVGRGAACGRSQQKSANEGTIDGCMDGNHHRYQVHNKCHYIEVLP
jgi:chromosome segregation ATPase